MGLLTKESALVLGGDPHSFDPVVLTSFGGRKDGLGLTLLERLMTRSPLVALRRLQVTQMRSIRQC